MKSREHIKGNCFKYLFPSVSVIYLQHNYPRSTSYTRTSGSAPYISHELLGSFTGVTMEMFVCEEGFNCKHNEANLIGRKIKDPLHPIFTYHFADLQDNGTAPQGLPSLKNLLHFGYGKERKLTFMDLIALDKNYPNILDINYTYSVLLS